ncbi:MAG: hypothetical protein ABIQ88_13475 [Chitinophagaceae bacterium]
MISGVKYSIAAGILLLAETFCAAAQNDLYAPVPAWKILDIPNWTGVQKSANGFLLPLPGTAVYTVPEGGKGWYQRGLTGEYDGVIDGRQWYGITADIRLEKEYIFEARMTLYIPEQKERHNLPDSAVAIIKLQGKGWHKVLIPFTSFDYNRGQSIILKYIQRFSFTGKYKQQVIAGSAAAFRNVKLVKGNPLHLDAVVRSQAGAADSTVHYQASICNSANKVQLVALSFVRTGWEGMQAAVEPASITLQPGEIRKLDIAVTVPALAPQGARETQTLVATTSNNLPPEKIDFITLRKLKGPFLVHQEQGWKEVLDKIKNYEWAKQSLADYIKLADDFIVPDVPPGGIAGEGSKAVYRGYTEQKLWPVAVAYKLTGQQKYAATIALFLNRLSAPGAYPATLHANHQGIPQEGGFFEVCARSYDLIKDAGILTQKEKELIEQTFRLYIYTVEDGLGNGGISNWSVFNLCPAAQCALVLQDMYHFDLLMNGPCGIKDHLKYGMMDDGWWYEMSLSYNLGCAENMTALGLAARPFGIDFLNEKIPVSLTQKVGLRPFEFESFLGMAFGKFGPVTNNYITVKRMWDAIVKYPDYRSVMFGMGDGHEHEVGGADFEKAYFAFRDTAFAAVIKQGQKRDLLYGIPELPGNTPTLFTQSAHSDNAGIAVLRSQTEGRRQKEQIQAALKYGTHGSYHGHFDRLSMVSLMRYGRSFWNPETSWFGYGNYMYKWWVQPSMAHNMVVVDGKQQEPVASKQLLFFSGKLIQAVAAETNARWSNPPYFGGYEHIEKVKAGDAPYVTIPTNHPKVTAVTDYTEPVLQRRLLIVTDDYVVTADYLKAAKEHVFDNLLHLRGAKADSALTPTGYASQFDSSPLSSGQFITSVTDYAVNGVGKVHSVLKADAVQSWESGGFNDYQEPGLLNIDVYNVWPQQTTLRIGNYAESYSINKKLLYEVTGDGKQLAKDSMGVWLLGRAEIDLPVKKIKILQLKTTKTADAKSNTLFWGGAKIVTAAGKEISLASLKTSMVNIVPAAGPGLDYRGGPIRIAGTAYTTALGAEPLQANEPGIITIDFTGMDAVRFVASIGGDAPVGNEEQVRKTVSFRSKGTAVIYLAVIEPYENNKMIKSIQEIDANSFEIHLNDGRSQKISINGLDTQQGTPTVRLQERKNGQLMREESTSNK